MPVTVWAMKEIVVSKIKKKKQYKLLWGAWSRGEGKKEPSNHYYVCWVRVRILAFTYHFWPSISASTLSWFTSLSLGLHRSGALDQYMKDRGDPPGHSEAKLDRFSPPPQRPLPDNEKLRKQLNACLRKMHSQAVVSPLPVEHLGLPMQMLKLCSNQKK